MKKQKLIWFKDDCDKKRYLTFAEPGDKSEHVGNATAIDYAKACDADAENCNLHDYCGVHVKLLKLLANGWGNDAADIMRAIAERGGLHRMNCR